MIKDKFYNIVIYCQKKRYFFSTANSNLLQIMTVKTDFKCIITFINQFSQLTLKLKLKLEVCQFVLLTFCQAS